MKYLICLLFSALGAGMCAYADWLAREGINTPDHGPAGWNSYGSAFLIVGITLFTFSVLQELWVIRKNTEHATAIWNRR